MVSELDPEAGAGALPERDPILDRVGQVSLRMMSGQVSRPTAQRLQKRLLGSPEAYPWEEVADEVLAEPVDPQRLVQQGLRSQRDWLLRFGRDAVGRRAKQQTKKMAAYVVSRVIFFVIYTVAAVVLLLLLKFHFGIDIYRILDWLRDLAPGVFGRNGG